MARNVIQEFLVAFGVELNQQQLARTQQQIKQGAQQTGKTVTEVEQQTTRDVTREYEKRVEAAKRMGDRIGTAINYAIRGAIAAVSALSANVGIVVWRLNDLENVSRRVGSSATNLRAFEHAIRQIGGTTQDALQGVEALAQALREQPGMKSFLAKMGVDATDSVEAMRQLSRVFRNDSMAFAIKRGETMGISPELVRLLRDPDFEPQMERTLKRFAGLGTTFDEASKNSRRLANEWRNLMLGFDLLNTKLVNNLIKGGFFDKLNDFMDKMAGPLSKIVDELGTKLGGWLDSMTEPLTKWLESGTALKDIEEFFMRIVRWAVELKDAVLAIADGIMTIASALQRLGLAPEKGESGYGYLKRQLTPAPLEGTREEREAENERKGAGRKRILDAIEREKRGTSLPESGTESGSGGWRSWLPSWLGGTGGASGGGGGGGGGHGHRSIRYGGRDTPGSGAPAPVPGPPGKYRPQYNLTAADLDDRVINTVAGEARMKDPQSVDAVINNMFNRIGTKWGGVPNNNLLATARAPGQYEGYRKATEQEAKYIRERITAIASGGVPDITGGANTFRAGWYGTGGGSRWFNTIGKDGKVIGGNRFAYDPNTPNGPFAPYATPRDVAAKPGGPLAGALETVRGVGHALGTAAAKATSIGSAQAARGGFDASRFDATKKASMNISNYDFAQRYALGGGGATNNNQKSITMNNNFETRVQGLDARDSASAFQRAQEGIAGHYLRQLGTAVQ